MDTFLWRKADARNVLAIRYVLRKPIFSTLENQLRKPIFSTLSCLKYAIYFLQIIFNKISVRIKSETFPVLEKLLTESSPFPDSLVITKHNNLDSMDNGRKKTTVFFEPSSNLFPDWFLPGACI